MHLFIDTNIFEKDPFWKNSFSKTLLDRAKEKKLNLYISKVVYEELKRHTIKNYKKAYKDYTGSVIELNRYLPNNSLIEPKNEIEKAFIDFYDELQDDYNLKVLDYKNEFFSKVMERALNRSKPFNDEKTEVKDCTIWLTYADYVETKKLEQSYLLTNNSKDFYKRNPKTSDPTEYEIHEELQADTKRFRAFPSIKDFFKIIVEPQIQASAKFQAWLTATNINEEYVFDIVYGEEASKVESAINNIVDRWEVDKVFNENEWFVSGYCQVNQIEWIDCTQVELDILEDYCIVNAIINLQVSVEGQAYNPAHDDGDDKYSYLGEQDFQASVSVSFILREDHEYDALDIDDIEMSPS
jgi:predicted nucleic acid-binding protein